MYYLEKTFLASPKEIRCIKVLVDGSIITGARDGKLNYYTNYGNVEEKFTLNVGSSISSLLIVDHNKILWLFKENEKILKNVKGVVFCGLVSGQIQAFAIEKEFIFLFKIKHHNAPVSALEFMGTVKTLISGSWDNTINLIELNNTNETKKIEVHSGTVWCLAVIPDYNLFLSGSADNSIILFKHDVKSREYLGHTQPVRDIKVFPDRKHFLSGGNDFTIRKWDIVSSECLIVFTCHDSYIYSLQICPIVDNLLIFTCGEEGQIAISKFTNNSLKFIKSEQSIVCTSTSVWGIDSFHQGSFVVGCSDGYLRIYSNLIDEASQIEDVNKSSIKECENVNNLLNDPNIPDINQILSTQGQRDGQLTVVRNVDKIEVYEWSEATLSWKKYGDATDNSVSSTNEIGNVKYDYVIDVDFENQKMLKLGVNKNEDSIIAAQRFLDQNNLPSSYLQQIIDYIQANIPIETPKMSTQISIKSLDYPHDPNYQFFKAVSWEKMTEKLISIVKMHKIVEISTLEVILNSCNQNLNNVSDSDILFNPEIFPYETYMILINQFSLTPNDILPIYDLNRLLCLNSAFSENVINEYNFMDQVQRFCNENEFQEYLSITMLVLRAVANTFCFSSNKAKKTDISFYFDTLMDIIRRKYLWSHQGCQITLVTILFNYLVYCNNNKNKKDFKLLKMVTVISGIVTWVVQNVISEYKLGDEPFFRLMVISYYISCNLKEIISKDAMSNLKNVLKSINFNNLITDIEIKNKIIQIIHYISVN